MTDLNEENDFTTFRKKNNPTYQDAFSAFKQRFLIDKRSIFNLDEDEKVLTEKSIKYLIENFVENGYSGNATFSEKIEHQLVTKPKAEDSSDKKLLMKGAIEILATAVWLWRLAPYNSTQAGKIKAVKEILVISTCEILTEKKGDDDKPLSIEDRLKTNNFFHCDIKGFASSGMRYNMNKPNELAYIIRFFEACIDKTSSGIDSLIGNGVLQNNKVSVQVKHDYSRKEKGDKVPELDKLNKGELEKWAAKYKDGKKPKSLENSASVHNALLHWLTPTLYEPILSNDYKKKIKKTFEHLIDDKSKAKDSPEIDVVLAEIKKTLIGKPYCIDETKAFYSDNIRSLWMSDIDFEAKNIILHGAPGTGKTYLTEKTIESRIAFDNPGSPVDDYFKLVQFHPSYGYEDFIDGIKPAGMDSNGNLKFELVNGEFKEMCIQAFRNLVHVHNENKKISNKKEYKKPKKFYFLADEINRAELSRVFGELLLCLEEDKRLHFDKKGKFQGTKIKTQNSQLWSKEHAVVVMNSDGVMPSLTKDLARDEKKESKKESYFFGVPENLYFIGTMNDIDRSVDSFDMALRRRFLWKHYQCDYDVLVEHYKIEDDHPYIEACRNLNKHITGSGTEKNKGFDLGESYELGHSYFMKPKAINQSQMNKAWEDNIAPLLKEYLRSTYPENEIKKHLKEAKQIFTLPTENK